MASTKKMIIFMQDKLPELDSDWLTNWMKGRVDEGTNIAEQHSLHLYKGIADFNNIRLHRLNGAIAGRNGQDEIDLFWTMLKSRLVKFRGLNGSTLYLHVKETEFRYNYRSSDIYEMLLDILHQQPLHTSKAMVARESIPGK